MKITKLAIWETFIKVHLWKNQKDREQIKVKGLETENLVDKSLKQIITR